MWRSNFPEDSNMQREIKFVPAWDRRGEGLGQHGMEIHFIERRAAGWAHAVFYSGWFVEWNTNPSRLDCAFLCFHQPDDDGEHGPGMEAGYRLRRSMAGQLVIGGEEAVWNVLDELFKINAARLTQS